ncbi:MAG: aspartate kinase, partial [Opitutales bacterium]
MNVVVQKYGGTSVADVDRIKKVARRVKSTVQAGSGVVVVVSARAGVTNQLIDRAKAIQKNPSERELDMLMTCGEQETIALLCMALHAIDVPAVSRTGWQVGILTEGLHAKARIREVQGGDLRKQVRAGNVVVVAGFQGVNDNGDVTTFGRGGSDLSAIALAGCLNAKGCQIYTDVEGVYTADPRIVPDARKITEINYEEMLELASSGSKVMQTRAVEFAQKHNIPFEVRSSFSKKSGTMVKKKVKSLE